MQLVTDRTEADMLLQNEKGTYNFQDLNRVESAVQELLTQLPKIGARVELEVKTDWGLPGDFSEDTWPTFHQMKRYLQNVKTLCDFCSLQIPNMPATMEDLTFDGANAIEEALEEVYKHISSIVRCLRYSGEFYAGEEIGL
jgi:hypothetical protein